MKRTVSELPPLLTGLQAFVCTPFTANNEIDLPRFREHLDYLAHGSSSPPKGIFVACGTGEFWSLDVAEHQALIQVAVDAVGRDVPIIAGVGYGTKFAVALARSAQAAGADGILVFPPYLISGPQAGLVEHFRAVISAVEIGVMVYHRDNAVLSIDTFRELAKLPNLIGVKDGFGDLQVLREMQAAIDRPFVFGNGMPVAETYTPTYARIGVWSYSPGIVDFLPELSWAFDRRLQAGDEAGVERLLDGFYRPLATLRAQTPGLGISLVKTGMALRGHAAGGVRAPLVDTTPEQASALAELIERGLALAKTEDAAESVDRVVSPGD